MKTTQFNALCAESAQGVAECLGILLAKLDVAELPTADIEALGVEIHALSTLIGLFKIRAAREIAARQNPPRDQE